MHYDHVRFMEHLSLRADLSLTEMCVALRMGMNLPEFQYDNQPEPEWGRMEVQHFELGIFRPNDAADLQLWDASTPQHSNFGVLLAVLDDAPADWDADWSDAFLVPFYGQVIANLLDCDVIHHSTWVGGAFLKRTDRRFISQDLLP